MDGQLLALLGGALLCGMLTQGAGTNRGYKNCFWLGFFLSGFGLIIVLFLKNKRPEQTISHKDYINMRDLTRNRKH